MPFTPPPRLTTRPTLKGDFGMSASTHWLATASSQSVLERGGNAFDAAVAAAFVLHIVEPHLNGPGGDMTAVLATASSPGSPVVINGQGPAPAAASTERYRQLGLTRVPGTGALAAAVPEAVDAWLMLLQEYGTWELGDVLAYAIHYAEAGHPIGPQASAAIGAVAQLFTRHWPTSAAQWMPGGIVPAPGTVVRNADYARVLRRLVDAGRGQTDRRARIGAARTEWRTGAVARAIARFAALPHRHSDGRDHAGVMTYEDLAAGRASLEEPVTAGFRG